MLRSINQVITQRESPLSLGSGMVSVKRQLLFETLHTQHGLFAFSTPGYPARLLQGDFGLACFR
jgi:hypothetical protein